MGDRFPLMMNWFTMVVRKSFSPKASRKVVAPRKPFLIPFEMILPRLIIGANGGVFIFLFFFFFFFFFFLPTTTLEPTTS